MEYPEQFKNLWNALSKVIDEEKKAENIIGKSITADNDIKTVNQDSKNKEECMICGDDLDDETKISCGHKYHYDCIYDWWCKIKSGQIGSGKYKQRECPYCRTQCKMLPCIGNKITVGVNITTKKGLKNNTVIDKDPHKCQAITCKGKQCKNSMKYGSYCGIHK